MNPLKHAARAGLAFCVAFNLAALPAQAGAPKAAAAKPAMTLQFYNVHTNEKLTLTRHAGEALPQNAAWFMRDYRRGATVNMDPRLFDLLGKLQRALVTEHPGLSVRFDVVSSYRTPVTNEALREDGGAQAEHSQHMLGKAMDIRVPGVSTRDLRDAASCLRSGGVGYYEQDKFVHLDVGRMRYWPSHDYLASLSCTATPRARLVAARKSPASKTG
jgi:uncharacterized protein YcbK (DUF882 family)